MSVKVRRSSESTNPLEISTVADFNELLSLTDRFILGSIVLGPSDSVYDNVLPSPDRTGAFAAATPIVVDTAGELDEPSFTIQDIVRSPGVPVGLTYVIDLRAFLYLRIDALPDNSRTPDDWLHEPVIKSVSSKLSVSSDVLSKEDAMVTVAPSRMVSSTSDIVKPESITRGD